MIANNNKSNRHRESRKPNESESASKEMYIENMDRASSHACLFFFYFYFFFQQPSFLTSESAN